MHEFNTVLLLSFKIYGLYLLVIRGVPSLIQTQVSAPLNSRPVDGYRKGGATPICTWSPAQSGSWDMLHVGLEYLTTCDLTHALSHQSYGR